MNNISYGDVIITVLKIASTVTFKIIFLINSFGLTWKNIMLQLILFLIFNSISQITYYFHNVIHENGSKLSTWIIISNEISTLPLLIMFESFKYVLQTFSYLLWVSSNIIYMCCIYISAFWFYWTYKTLFIYWIVLYYDILIVDIDSLYFNVMNNWLE